MSGRTFDLGRVINDAKQVIVNPQRFYRTMPSTGGYADPALFVLVTGAISGVILFIINLLGLGTVNPMGSSGLLMLIIVPVGSLIASFVAAGILFLIWRLMGSNKNYQLAYRCVAYSMAIAPVMALLSIIPYIGNIVRAIWSCGLLYLASVEVHGLKAQTAKIVFGILAAISVVMMVKAESVNRNIADAAENFDKRLEDMSPEEANKAVGKFLQGLEKAAREAEQASKN